MLPKTPAYHVINDALVHVRDGEVVLYRRENSKRWQARFKLDDSSQVSVAARLERRSGSSG